MIKKIFNEKSEGDGYKMYKVCLDIDVICIKCDRFVDSVDGAGLCHECAETEKHESELLEVLK